MKKSKSDPIDPENHPNTIFFKDMVENKVYTCLGPKGVFTKVNNQVWFESYFSYHRTTMNIVNDKKILFPTNHEITLNEENNPVFPRRLKLGEIE